MDQLRTVDSERLIRRLGRISRGLAGNVHTLATLLCRTPAKVAVRQRIFVPRLPKRPFCTHQRRGRPRLTKGGQLRLHHAAIEQDCNWVFRCWPCALLDQKNDATAPGLAPNWHMAQWRKPPCLALPSEARSSHSSSPHYSRALLLQSRIRRCDTLGRMFHSAQAGGLAARSVNILFKDASLPPGSTRPSRVASQRFRHEPS